MKSTSSSFKFLILELILVSFALTFVVESFIGETDNIISYLASSITSSPFMYFIAHILLLWIITFAAIAAIYVLFWRLSNSLIKEHYSTTLLESNIKRYIDAETKDILAILSNIITILKGRNESDSNTSNFLKNLPVLFNNNSYSIKKAAYIDFYNMLKPLVWDNIIQIRFTRDIIIDEDLTFVHKSYARLVSYYMYEDKIYLKFLYRDVLHKIEIGSLIGSFDVVSQATKEDGLKVQESIDGSNNITVEKQVDMTES